MKSIELKELLEAGCHFGHKVNKWNPKAASFIYKAVGDTHIIDLAKTKDGLEKAAEFITRIVSSGKAVLFVGTKRQATQIIVEHAKPVGVPYLSKRWIGGFLTNWTEVQKNVAKLTTYKEQLASKNALADYTKRERLLLEREVRKLEEVYGGVVDMKELPAAICIIDTKKEFTAVEEAHQVGIPIIGVVDTNANPNIIDYVVPANDDAVGSITLITSYLVAAYAEGKRVVQDAQKKAEKQANVKSVAAVTPKKTPGVKVRKESKKQEK